MTLNVKPVPILLEDIDLAVYNWFNDHKIILHDDQGKTSELSVIYVNTEKWAELKKTWALMENVDNINIRLPVMTIYRKPGNIQKSEPIRFRIPNKKFIVSKVPCKTSVGVTYDLYVMPQPIKLSLAYIVHIISHYMVDINSANEYIFTLFSSCQSYLKVKDIYDMPMKLESATDESKDGADDERLLMSTFELIVDGYLINEDEIEKVRGIPRIVTFTETTS